MNDMSAVCICLKTTSRSIVTSDKDGIIINPIRSFNVHLSCQNWPPLSEQTRQLSQKIFVEVHVTISSSTSTEFGGTPSTQHHREFPPYISLRLTRSLLHMQPRSTTGKKGQMAECLQYIKPHQTVCMVWQGNNAVIYENTEKLPGFPHTSLCFHLQQLHIKQ